MQGYPPCVLHCMRTACALHVHCMCTACALHLHCVCTACALHVYCTCAACTLQVPSHAVYEMLMRGCTIAMRRVGPGEQSDHITRNLIGRVGELWAEMQVAGRKPDYKTYNELIRAYGKASRRPVTLCRRGCSPILSRLQSHTPSRLQPHASRLPA